MVEAFKSINNPKFLIKMEKGTRKRGKSSITRTLKEDTKTKIVDNIFSLSAAEIWNQAPRETKEAKTIYKSKVLIKKYCKDMSI